MLTYRKTKEGKWVVFGAAAEVRVGEVTVTKKDGTTKTEVVSGLGNPFAVNGVPHVYGYLEPRPAPSARSGRSSRGCRGCGGAIVHASHHRAMQGYCGHCAFDEFDM